MPIMKTQFYSKFKPLSKLTFSLINEVQTYCKGQMYFYFVSLETNNWYLRAGTDLNTKETPPLKHRCIKARKIIISQVNTLYLAWETKQMMTFIPQFVCLLSVAQGKEKENLQQINGNLLAILQLVQHLLKSIFQNLNEPATIHSLMEE